MISTREQPLPSHTAGQKIIDPRIDSPDVQVIYPSATELAERQTLQHGKADTVEKETTFPPPIPLPQDQPQEKKEDHVCKVDIQEAVKQNLVGFIALIVVAFGIGYLIGKK